MFWINDNKTTLFRTDEASTTNGTEDERWLELELEMLERMSVRTQTVEEILAEVFKLKHFYFIYFKKNEFALDEEEFLLSAHGGDDGFSAATGLGLQLPPMGRYGAVSTELPSSYTLDSPLVLSREGFINFFAKFFIFKQNQMEFHAN